MQALSGLYVQSVKDVDVQVVASTNIPMQEIKLGDSSNLRATPNQVEATLRMSEAQRISAGFAVGVTAQLSAGVPTDFDLQVDAVGPGTITEDVATAVMLAGVGFSGATKVVVYDDSDEILLEADATVVSDNAVTASVTIADAVIGSIGVRIGADTYSNAVTFTVEAA